MGVNRHISIINANDQHECMWRGLGLSCAHKEGEILFYANEFSPIFASLVITEMQIKTKVIFFPLATNFTNIKKSSRKSEEWVFVHIYC